MYDIFYQGQKPNLFPFEREAKDLVDAANKSKTKFFWFLHGDNDYTGFDFYFTPAPWQTQYIHTWPSQWQRNGATYLASKASVQQNQKHYMPGPVVLRKPNKEGWVEIDPVAEFDYSWHLDPDDADWECYFGSNWFAPIIRPALAYNLETNGQKKKYFVQPSAKLAPTTKNWYDVSPYEIVEFDYSWVPNPKDPPFIYVFGNQRHSAEHAPTVEYHVPGATQRKYINDLVATVKVDDANWQILKPEHNWIVDKTWIPDPADPPYIYVFGNPWYSAIEMPTAEYHVPGATERKYMDENILSLAVSPQNWVILKLGDKWDIDPKWMPNPFEPPYIYVFGNPWYSAIEMPTAEYRVPGATQYKYCDEKVLTIKAAPSCWKILRNEAKWEIDTRWVPNPFEPPYIYVFGNPWYGPVEMPTAEYHVPGATERKYVDDQVLTVKPNNAYWKVLKNEAKWEIDRNWMPNPFEPPYIYVFGNPWYTAEQMPTVEYHVPGATERKYSDEKVIALKADPALFKVLKTEAQWDIDPNWAPNPFEPPYIHVFGNPWYSAVEMPTVEYHVPGATERKYNDEKIVRVKPSSDLARWKTLRTECDWNIDIKWMPNPFSPPYIYVHGNQWYPAEHMPTAEYHVPGATERKYVDENVVTPKRNNNHWKYLFPNVDISSLDKWVPNPFEPPFIYVFGNQWYPANEMPTVEYHVPGATERKYIGDFKALLTPTRTNWYVPEEVNASVIDFSWIPHPKDPAYIYHFSSEFQMSVGLTYTVPGATEIKFETQVPILKKKVGARIGTFSVSDVKQITQPVSMFFVDMNNKQANVRFDALKQRYPDIQKIRFMNGWLETIKRCVTRSKTQKFWVISSENIYDNFNFEWHAQPWQNYMTHVFASQWQKWSDTFLIHKGEFERHAKWAKKLEEFPNLNFVKDQPVLRPDDLFEIFFVSHYNAEASDQLQRLVERYAVRKTRFVDNYLDTFKRIVSQAQTEYIWIVSSRCDYRKFDFSWQPEPWQAEMLHVFPTDDQKFGDTFYMHVPTFKEQMDKLELLDWFKTVNYCGDQIVPRHKWKEVIYNDENLTQAILNHTFDSDYVLFKNVAHKDVQVTKGPSLWRTRNLPIITFAQDNSVALVPRISKEYIKEQVYDYPHITKNKFISARSQDVVFISNGEPMADNHWEILKAVCPRAKRSDGVLGREKAYKAAAGLSSTPWFYAVFAKTEVLPDFGFDIQPDYFQQPKHYILHSRNALNGLEYGAMNINLYNKQLVLDTKPGLDFTLSASHEVIPICASISRFNTDPWITWRSAFREVLKLKKEVDEGAPEIIKHRLDVWCSKAEGENAEYCLQGANDALEFYIRVGGNMEQLKLSFDWEWLEQFYLEKYKTKIW